MLCVICDLTVNQGDVSTATDSGQRIGSPDDDVGILTNLQAANPVSDAQKGSCVDGDGFPGFLKGKPLAGSKARAQGQVLQGGNRGNQHLVSLDLFYCFFISILFISALNFMILSFC